MNLPGGLTIGFRMDEVALFFVVLTTTMFLLTALFSVSYTDHDAHRGRFFVLLLLTLVALVGLSTAKNLLTFYLCFETLSLVSFPLVLHFGTLDARRAAVKYFGFSVFGATVALCGMILLGNACMADFQPGGLHLPDNSTARVAALLMLIGFCCKAGVMPLSNWLPTAHPEAPAPASALLSGVITKAGMVGAIRVCGFVFGVDQLRGTFVQNTMLLLALATILIGSLLAYREPVLKKRLAYSSVSQLSYVILGVMTLNAAGIGGALLQITFHSTAKAGLFLCAGAIMHQTGLTRVDQLEGIGKRMPLTMVCFTAYALSLVGIPPFGGFAAKVGLASGAYGVTSPAWFGSTAVVVLLISALLTAGYLFPIVGKAFFHGKQPESTCMVDVCMGLPLCLLALFVLAAGLFPTGLTQFFSRVAALILGGAV